MLFSLCQGQLRHIRHASINIATYVLGGRRWHGIWRISRSPTRYWGIFWLCRCVLWRSGQMFTHRWQLRWINEWIIQWSRHSYHQWWQLIALWVNVLAIKAPVITSVATANTLWTWHDECNISLLWCCVHVILFVDFQKKVRAIFLRDNCSYVWVSVPRKKCTTSFLSQYNQN